MKEALQDLYYKVNVYGLHDVHAAAKRVAATKVEGPAVDAMRTLIQELLPLAQAVTGLKDKVVKGRAPVPSRPPANPDQLRMNCGAPWPATGMSGLGAAGRPPAPGAEASPCSFLVINPLFPSLILSE